MSGEHEASATRDEPPPACPPGDPLEHVGELLPDDHDPWAEVSDDADVSA